MATGLYRMRHLNGFEDAAIINARVGASKMGFIQWKDGYGPELEDGEGPAGRLVLDRRPGELRVVDLSIAPRARRRGLARALLLALQQEAREGGHSLSLRVRADNAAARSLYAGLGFEAGGAERGEGEEAANRELRWRPPQKE